VKLVSQHHTFDINLAAKYGVYEALLIHHFQHWIQLNINKGINEHDGRTWSYQKLDDIAFHFPYMTREQVRDTLERLCTGKNRKSERDEVEFEPVLVKGNYNKHKFDRTTWYAFKNQEIFTVRGNPQMERGISPKDDGDIPTTIPDTKTDTKPDIERETSKEVSSPSSKSAPRKPPDKSISFDADEGVFQGITPQDMQNFADAYPGIDLKREIARMEQWILSNPKKARKRNWRRFLTTWLQKASDDHLNKEMRSQAIKTSFSSKVDRRTKDKNGNPVEMEDPFETY